MHGKGVIIRQQLAEPSKIKRYFQTPPPEPEPPKAPPSTSQTKDDNDKDDDESASASTSTSSTKVRSEGMSEMRSKVMSDVHTLLSACRQTFAYDNVHVGLTAC